MTKIETQKIFKKIDQVEEKLSQQIKNLAKLKLSIINDKGLHCNNAKCNNIIYDDIDELFSINCNCLVCGTRTKLTEKQIEKLKEE